MASWGARSAGETQNLLDRFFAALDVFVRCSNKGSTLLKLATKKCASPDLFLPFIERAKSAIALRSNGAFDSKLVSLIPAARDDVVRLIENLWSRADKSSSFPIDHLRCHIRNFAAPDLMLGDRDYLALAIADQQYAENQVDGDALYRTLKLLSDLLTPLLLCEKILFQDHLLLSIVFDREAKDAFLQLELVKFLEYVVANPAENIELYLHASNTVQSLFAAVPNIQPQVNLTGLEPHVSELRGIIDKVLVARDSVPPQIGRMRNLFGDVVLVTKRIQTTILQAISSCDTQILIPMEIIGAAPVSRVQFYRPTPIPCEIDPQSGRPTYPTLSGKAVGSTSEALSRRKALLIVALKKIEPSRFGSALARSQADFALHLVRNLLESSDVCNTGMISTDVGVSMRKLVHQLLVLILHALLKSIPLPDGGTERRRKLDNLMQDIANVPSTTRPDSDETAWKDLSLIVQGMTDSDAFLKSVMDVVALLRALPVLFGPGLNTLRKLNCFRLFGIDVTDIAATFRRMVSWPADVRRFLPRHIRQSAALIAQQLPRSDEEDIAALLSNQCLEFWRTYEDTIVDGLLRYFHQRFGGIPLSPLIDKVGAIAPEDWLKSWGLEGQIWDRGNVDEFANDEEAPEPGQTSGTWNTVCEGDVFPGVPSFSRGLHAFKFYELSLETEFFYRRHQVAWWKFKRGEFGLYCAIKLEHGTVRQRT